MKNPKIRQCVRAFSAAMALSLVSAIAFAHDYAKDALLIDHPWARPTLSAVAPAAVYFDIVNRGGEDDKLLSVKTGRAKHVELHVTETDDDGVASMKMLKDGLTAPAKKTVSMETGSYHVMLIGLDAALKEGEAFPLTLTFEKAGEVEVIVKVENRTPEQEAAEHHSHH